MLLTLEHPKIAKAKQHIHNNVKKNALQLLNGYAYQ